MTDRLTFIASFLFCLLGVQTFSNGEILPTGEQGGSEGNVNALVTFTVDMRCETGFSTVGITGPFFGWCGDCVPLSDDDGDGFWSTTLEIDENDPNLPDGMLEYKYIINGFMDQEDLIDDMVAGGDCAPITDFNSYANRQVLITDGASFNDTYGSCAPCDPTAMTGCTDEAATNFDPTAITDDGSCLYDVVFNVDMNCVEESFGQVELTGPFTNWCAGCITLTDEDEDGIYSVTINRPSELLEYKYSIDFFVGQEDLIDDVQMGQGGCAPITDGESYANRQVQIDGDTQIADTYGSCSACESNCPGDVTGDNMVDVNDFIGLNSAFGSICGNCPEDLTGDGLVDVNDFIQLNSFFGQTCD